MQWSLVLVCEIFDHTELMSGVNDGSQMSSFPFDFIEKAYFCGRLLNIMDFVQIHNTIIHDQNK